MHPLQDPVAPAKTPPPVQAASSAWLAEPSEQDI